MGQFIGKQSIIFENAPYIISGGAIVGKKEGEGPLKNTFDEIENDPTFGGENWEEGESVLQTRTAKLAISKACMKEEDIRYIFAGDLLGQLIATTYGVKDLNIPLFGLYGACSTMGESMGLAAMTVAAGYADNVLAMASSHFGSAEKTFRFPLEYGSQRPFSTTWTVTGCGATVISKNKGFARITGITTGKIVDYGFKDPLNMGAVMAPAAADVIACHLKDFDRKPDYYDKIITGDLGYVGKKILIDFLRMKGYDISQNHYDCGIEIYDMDTQDTHAGGSGCGCSASVLCGNIYSKLMKKEWKRVLFVPTGALMSTVSHNEGRSVPGIAHCVAIET